MELETIKEIDTILYYKILDIFDDLNFLEKIGLVTNDDFKGKNAADLGAGHGAGCIALKHKGVRSCISVDNCKQSLEEAIYRGFIQEEEAILEDAVEFLEKQKQESFDLVTGFNLDSCSFPVVNSLYAAKDVIRKDGKILLMGYLPACDLELREIMSKEFEYLSRSLGDFFVFSEDNFYTIFFNRWKLRRMDENRYKELRRYYLIGFWNKRQDWEKLREKVYSVAYPSLFR